MGFAAAVRTATARENRPASIARTGQAGLPALSCPPRACRDGPGKQACLDSSTRAGGAREKLGRGSDRCDKEGNPLSDCHTKRATVDICPVTLEGRSIRLVPLAPAHLDGMCDVGLDPDLWRWTPAALRSRSDMKGYIEAALKSQAEGTALPFVTLEQATGTIVGSTRYGNIDRTSRRVEIGWTWVGMRWQRTAVNTEAKYLMLLHAFEILRCHRVEFKTDFLNERSRAALRRIGAKEEGVLRQHMVTATGRLRDTVYYSIIDTEWPDARQIIEGMLARGPSSR